MSRYTVELREILKDEHSKELIDKALSTYPLYVKRSIEEYIPSIIPTREELNKKLINHYKYREIGFETVGRFIDELEIAMCEIMPYYNQLFFSADQDFNIIYNVDYKRTITSDKTGNTSADTTTSENGNVETTGTGTSTTSSSGNTDTTSTVDFDGTSTKGTGSKNVSSDTPQNELGISASNIDKVTYANNVTWNAGSENETQATTTDETASTESKSTSDTDTEQSSTATSTSEGSASVTGTTSETENRLETTKGNFGVVSAQDLIAKYREIIINIEQMIINDERIKELFMLVY